MICTKQLLSHLKPKRGDEGNHIDKGNEENTIDKNVSASQRQIYRVQISSGNNGSAESGTWDISQHHLHSQMSSDPKPRIMQYMP